jgi:hypothetical protein
VDGYLRDRGGFLRWQRAVAQDRGPKQRCRKSPRESKQPGSQGPIQVQLREAGIQYAGVTALTIPGILVGSDCLIQPFVQTKGLGHCP